MGIFSNYKTISPLENSGKPHPPTQHRMGVSQIPDVYCYRVSFSSPHPLPSVSLSLCLSLSLSHTQTFFRMLEVGVRAHEWAFFSMYDIYIFPRYPFHLSITNQTATTLTQLQTELSWEKLDTIKKKKAVDNSDLCQNLKRITFVMKQNGFKSRWLTGTVLPHCSGKKTNEYFEKASPEVKKKKNPRDCCLLQ